VYYMTELVLIRHGQSQWNLENRFTGWTDVDLSQDGVNEAIAAGNALKDGGYTFDIAYTSYLKRAVKTLNIILEQMDLLWLETKKDWRLNERHYGALQGLNKSETAIKYGDEQVKLWRRSFDIQPPVLSETDPRNPATEIKYKLLSKTDLPLTESLENTIQRAIPYWESEIVPKIKSGKKVLISAHGNSLRALIKNLEGISDQDIISLEIPTGKPLVYKLDDNQKVVEKFYL
jgi:2,3-bisphosphoglycerate-dependent phosphoglycerate mutase